MLLIRYARGRVRSSAAVASSASAPVQPPLGLRPLMTAVAHVETVPASPQPTHDDSGKGIKRRAGRSVFKAVASRVQLEAGESSTTPPLAPSPNRIRNNLLKYIDPTGQEPMASTLSEIEPDASRRAWLEQVLAAENATAAEFLCWKDVASTSTLADALARLRSCEDSRRERLRLPPWFVSVLLERSSYNAGTVYQLIRRLCEDVGRYNRPDQLALLQMLVRLACRHRFWAILPRLVDEALQGDGVDSTTQHRVIGFLEPITDALRSQTPTSFDPHSPSGMLRRQLDRLLTAADLTGGSKVRGKYLRMLFHSQVLDRRLRRSLEDILEATQTPMTFKQTRACFLSAVKADDAEDAQRYFNRLSTSELDLADQLKFAAILAKHKRALESLVELATLEESFSRNPAKISKSWMYALKVAQEQGSTSRLLRSLPTGRQDLGTLTALMNAHLASNRFGEVLDIWHSIEQRRSELDVDVVALSAAVKATSLRDGVEQAVRLLDAWARRPMAAKASVAGTRTIQLDTIIVNIVLEACKRQREADIAFRIWQAMEPRWDVQPDAYSLALILSCANHAKPRGSESGMSLRQAFLRSFRSEQQLADEDEDGEEAILNDVNARSLFARGNVSLLLDRSDDDDQLLLLTWKTGRALFRQVVFSNWPHLRQLSSPLTSTSLTRNVAAPPASSRYAHILPNESTFDAFTKLLGRHGIINEIPIALAWMKALNITPKRTTLCMALLQLDSASGPSRPRRVVNHDGQMEWLWLRDDQLLARWLREWLGQDGVPDDDEVARYRVEKMRTRFV